MDIIIPISQIKNTKHEILSNLLTIQPWAGGCVYSKINTLQGHLSLTNLFGAFEEKNGYPITHLFKYIN